MYGTTLTDSEIAASTLKRAEVYPDSTSGSDRISFEYNRQRQVTEIQDQGGTVHAMDFDKLGRPTQDRVTTLGTGIDGAVRRLATTYEVRGMREKITSYDDATVGQGNIVNEVQFAYNDFGQLTDDYQAHAGAVNVMSTPKVQYDYANGSANTVRAESLTYPDGRVLTYSYGTADGIDDASSRIASLVDDDVSSTHLVDYDYLGRGMFVGADDTEPEVKWTLFGASDDPDTGDIYSGFDRFSRVKDNRWYDTGTSADLDRIKYGYDRNGNRIWRENTVAAAAGKHFDELYLNDLINRLGHMDRGSLNANKDAVTNLQFAQCWQLDETGNWKNFREDDDGDGSWDLNQDRTANKVNEITDVTETTGPSWVTPAYDAAGNMTTIPQSADPTSSYAATFDAWNRLVKLVDGSDTVAEHEYDGAKRRAIAKNYAGGVLDETRHFYYTDPSKWQVVEERVDSSSDPDRQFVWGLRYVDDCVLRDRDTTGNGTLDERLYGMQDANWNMTALVNASGVVQERYAYSAYGMPIFLTSALATQSGSSLNWETLYAGYRFDSATNLYYARNRYLHAALGLWISRDPLGYFDSPNLYQYVDGNPLVFTDSHGLAVAGGLDDLLAACIAVGGPACLQLAALLGIAIGILLALIALGWGIKKLIDWKFRQNP